QVLKHTLKRREKGGPRGHIIIIYRGGNTWKTRRGIHWGGRGISVLGTNRQAVANFSGGDMGKGFSGGTRTNA
ncbi:hypothetical protein K0F36_21530, partial [Bacteroides fragilis]|nr:hypothetical protein [Bacteroides fragilis]